jgi:CRP-like cAMP-binding protein
MPSQDNLHRINRLLAALPGEEFQTLLPSLEVMSLARGDMMIEPEQSFRYVWFPHYGVVSVVTPLADGTEVEAATIGREGVVGCEFLTGGDRGISRTFVQVSGEASRIGLAQLRCRQAASGTLADLLDRYARALFKQVMQSVACNGQHSVEERCCRWLLMAHDRAGSDSFDLTRNFCWACVVPALRSLPAHCRRRGSYATAAAPSR